MKKLILLIVLFLAIYLIVRQGIIGPETTPPDEGLENLTNEEKVRALDELKVLYPKEEKKIDSKAPPVAKRKVEKAFYQGNKDEFDRLEKVQYLDERGNPVNLDEEGEP